MFEKFIVATDLSEASASLIECLQGLKVCGAKKCLLLMCLNIQDSTSLAFSYSTNVIDNILNEQKHILESQGYEVEVRTVTPSVTAEINRIAIDEGYSLIVVGTKKRSKLGEKFFGGIAYDLIHHAEKPVLIIKQIDTSMDEQCCYKSISISNNNKLLFPTDFSENAELAFSYVRDLVKSGIKNVSLLHIQDKEKMLPHLADKLDEFNKIDRQRLMHLKDILEKDGASEVNIEIILGNPSVEILNKINEKDIQLVVMGSQGRGFVKELFIGSVSHNISRQAEANVLLIPSKRS